MLWVSVFCVRQRVGSDDDLYSYGIVGLLRPLTVYPSEMVYWTNLPTVSTFQGRHPISASHK